MKILRMYPTSLNDRFLDQAAAELSAGATVIFPTDTLYALGCDALDNAAVEQLCRTKGLDPRRNTLSVVCADLSMASGYARIDNEAFRILRANLPGPFTFILPASPRLPKVFKGRRTVGIRIPSCPIATALAATLGHPVMCTSVPGEAPDPAGLALDYEGRASMLIDGGTAGDIPSTVVDLTDSRNPIIIREGKGQLQ